MTSRPVDYDHNAVDHYFSLLSEVSEQQGTSRYSLLNKARLVVVRDEKKVEHIAFRALRWYEVIFTKLGLGTLAFLFGGGNADLRRVIRVAEAKKITHVGLMSLALRYSDIHKKLSCDLVAPEALRNLPREQYDFLLHYIKEDFSWKTCCRNAKHPIIIALQRKYFHAVRYLLESALDVDALKALSSHLVHAAYDAQDRELLLKILTTYGTDVPHPETGRTLLARACLSGEPDMIEILLNAGADPHYNNHLADETGLLESPFTIVCDQPNHHLVQEFLKRTPPHPRPPVVEKSLSLGLKKAISNYSPDLVKAILKLGVEVRKEHINTVEEKLRTAETEAQRTLLEQIKSLLHSV